MLTMKSEKRETIKRKKLMDQEIIRTLEEKENYKYDGIVKAHMIKQRKMKEEMRKK